MLPADSGEHLQRSPDELDGESGTQIFPAKRDHWTDSKVHAGATPSIIEPINPYARTAAYGGGMQGE